LIELCFAFAYGSSRRNWGQIARKKGKPDNIDSHQFCGFIDLKCAAQSYV
jgi:hypothetical protein